MPGDFYAFERLSLWVQRQRRPLAVPEPDGDSSRSATRALGHGIFVLITAVVVLAALSALAGLVTDVYRDPAAVIPAMRGQDLITLATLPVLLVALSAMRLGSARATLLVLGLLGYIAYTAVGAAFAYRYNSLFIVYVALFSTSSFAFTLVARQVDAEAVKRKFDFGLPRRAMVAFLLLVAVILAVSELAQLGVALFAGTVPVLIARSAGAGNFVYALDLGVVMPLSIVSAVGLSRRLAWSYVTSGVLLIKSATMGLALLSATWFSVRAGEPLEAGLTAAYASIALGGLVLTIWFLRHCRG